MNGYHVGLQYTSGYVHGNTSNSNILGSSTSQTTTDLYGWYNVNIKPTYETLIDSNVGFCSDRENYADENGTTPGEGGLTKKQAYYETYIRYIKENIYKTTFTPILKCKNNLDLLKLPVGLLSTDEYMLAGGGVYVNGVNTYYNDLFWLHTGQTYWTISPREHAGSTNYPWVFSADSVGKLSSGRVKYEKYGVRPVINLKSTTTFENNGADGTASKPYIVKTP